MKPTRGERNNNPGNLERTNIAWQGLIQDNSEPRFCVFETPFHGIRALGRNLLTYQKPPPKGRGLRTVQQMIDTWAPPHENDTSAYVNHVASVLNVGPDADVDLMEDGVLESLVRAVILHENGRCKYSHDEIAAACEAAKS